MQEGLVDTETLSHSLHSLLWSQELGPLSINQAKNAEPVTRFFIIILHIINPLCLSSQRK